MHVLYVMDNSSHFNYMEHVIRALVARGHQVTLLYGEGSPSKRRDQAARDCQKELGPSLQLGPSLCRASKFRRCLFVARETLNYAWYLRRSGQSKYYCVRWRRYLPHKVRWATHWRAGKRFIASEMGRWMLRSVEHLYRPDRAISRYLQESRPDAMVVSPANLAECEEVEYLKAGEALGIPTAGLVMTWDNLSTKGLFHVKPDMLMAWNRTHYDEARAIHRFPPDKLVITGSPFFERWFYKADRLLVDRQTFCKTVGVDPSRPFVAYLGSSRNIARDETWLVRELAIALRLHPNAALRDLGILVRPHPNNARNLKQLQAEGVAVWPADGMVPDTDEGLAWLYSTLAHCACAVGVNTTGMMDAVILDRPCLTVLADRYRSKQYRAMHFGHLLKADVLEVTTSVAQCVGRIEAILRGEDIKKPQRQQFVRDFVRPRGMDRSAGEVAAVAIELLASGKTCREIEQHLAGADGGPVGRAAADRPEAAASV